MKNHFDSLRFCPICGSPELLPNGKSCKQCNRCSYRTFDNPVVAVGAFIFSPSKKILLTRRAIEPGFGMLSLPGGFAEAGESLETALRRETSEETGISLTGLHYLTSAPNSYNEGGIPRAVCDVFFTAHTTTETVLLQESEASEWLWLSLPEVRLEEIAFPTVRLAFACLKENFSSICP